MKLDNECFDHHMDHLGIQKLCIFVTSIQGIQIKQTVIQCDFAFIVSPHGDKKIGIYKYMYKCITKIWESLILL